MRDAATGVTWRWVVGLSIAALGAIMTVVIALGAYIYTTNYTAMNDRIKALEERQLPATERIVNIEGSIKRVDDKIESLRNDIGNLSSQMQADRIARQASAR
jgi:TolA-binding protein